MREEIYHQGHEGHKGREKEGDLTRIAGMRGEEEEGKKEI
jgi:hypothetical protein